MKYVHLPSILLAGSLLAFPTNLHPAGLFEDWEFGGFAEAEVRVFPETPADPRQFDHFDASLALEPELFRRWDQPGLRFTLRPFVRLDLQDPERTHGDLREFLLHKTADAWELRAGVGKTFWGVTESQHLVDVINQTDLIENIDREDKLGQPMVHFSWISANAGTFGLFYLPYFRERTFPGEKGRLRTAFPVDTDHPIFESELKRWHPDIAVRWSHAVGNFDFGVHYFYGTSRDPLFQPAIGPGNDLVLRPVYNLMHQVGLDLQWTHEGWLWKLEALARDGVGQHYQAFVAGFEYTFYGLFGSSMDLGLLAEYNFDSRGQEALNPLNRDLFAGGRLTWNDTQDTALLGGVFWDHETGSTSLRLELERRLAERWTLELQAQWFAHSAERDSIRDYRRDSFLQLALRRYF